jgi:hypothetical protein
MQDIKILLVVLYNNDGPVRSETFGSSLFYKYCCELNDSCVHLLAETVDVAVYILKVLIRRSRFE